MSDDKTNVMRILDRHRIPYVTRRTQVQETNGVRLCALLGVAPERCFKTLVTLGRSGTPYIFVIPVAEALDLKKAARAVGEKSVEMLKAKELLPLTGYVHGGCSPIGMKKLFRTTLHETGRDSETITVSAGRIGVQVELSAAALATVIPLTYADLTVSANDD